MGRYLTPLPGLLANAVDQALNQAISLDDEAKPRLAAMAGRRVKLVLTGIGIDLHFSGSDQRLRVEAQSDSTPDTTITGSPSALLALAVPDWRAPGSGVRIEGDAGAAQALEKLLRRLDPDWEAWLVERLGPVIGHNLWRLLNDAAGAGQHVARTAADQVAHYLREESGLLVTQAEVDSFVGEVDELREAVDRLENRLRREGRA